MRKLLCFIGLHQYEDKIHLRKYTKEGLPFEAKEVCKGCGKIRKEIKGYIVDGNFNGPLKGVKKYGDK